MVILISCSTLSLVLGSDLHSLFAPPPRTLSMLNLVLLRGSHAEQSSLCNLLVRFESPAIKSWNKKNASISISPLVIMGAETPKTIPKVEGRKNTGQQKERLYFAQKKSECEQECKMSQDAKMYLGKKESSCRPPLTRA